jgi:hypothetical protein
LIGQRQSEVNQIDPFVLIHEDILRFYIAMYETLSLLARPILQEYDAFTEVEVGVDPAESWEAIR